MFELGIICGVLLSLLAILVGKKLTVQINNLTETPKKEEKGPHMMAQIIKLQKDPVDEVLNNG